METHQKDIEEKDPFGQNRAEADEADEAGNDEKSFLKALLAERALKNVFERKTKQFCKIYVKRSYEL